MSETYYRVDTLESKARQILTKYRQTYLSESPQPVPIEKIIEEMFGLVIDYLQLTFHKNELGRMIYDNGYSTYFNQEINDYKILRVRAGTMLIEASLLDNPKSYGRYRFTLAHELAHWILHKNLFVGTRVAAATYDTDKVASDSTEWQANYLAKAILMPVGQLKRAYYAVNKEPVTKLQKIVKLSNTFEVSKQAIEIRLSELGLHIF